MVFARRFRQARERSGLTQEQVAVAAGIDEMSASARISQYENGRHLPRYQIAVRLAHGLGVPVAYLYTPDDMTAELLLLWCDLPLGRRAGVLQRFKDVALDAASVSASSETPVRN